jgi:hypothetical protein
MYVYMLLLLLLQACTQGGELLRALSMFGHRFLIVGVDTSLSLELVKQMFQASWFQVRTRHLRTDGQLVSSTT